MKPSTVPPPSPWGTRRRRLGVTVPAAIGLLLAACASDPYGESVALTAREKQIAAEQPNAAAAAALLRVAAATRAAGDYASAINVLKRAHKLAPDDTDIAIELGESLAAVRAYDEAREMMVAAIKLQPRETRALRGLANALVALSEPALAITRYHEALAIRPEAATYNGLAVALDILNDGAGAEEAYRSGLALDPHNPSLIGNLALSLALQGRHKDAIDLVAAELRAGRSTARLRQNLALVYGLAGRTDDARALLRIDLDPVSVRNNIAYYEMLRGLKPGSRRDTVLGRRAIVASKDIAGGSSVPPAKAEPTRPPVPSPTPGSDAPALPAAPLPGVSPDATPRVPGSTP